MTYFSRPQSVEAIQWTGDNGPDLIAAFDGKVTIEQHRTAEEWHCALLAGKDGAQEWVPVPVGHWLVHPPGDLSDIWPVEDAYFQEKYAAAPADDFIGPCLNCGEWKDSYYPLGMSWSDGRVGFLCHKCAEDRRVDNDRCPDGAHHGDFSIGSDVWPGTSKVIEEMGEALQVLGKLIGTGGDPTHWDGSDLRERLVEELGDVLGAIWFFTLCNLSVQELIDVNERSDAKRLLFEQWHAGRRSTSND